MLCGRCGGSIRGVAAFCSVCGSPVPRAEREPELEPVPTPLLPAPPTDRLALASLFAGICALPLGWFLPVVGTVVAVGLGHVARRRIKRSGQQAGGRGYALAGIILGYLALAAYPVRTFGRSPARLAIQTHPEGPFAVGVSQALDGPFRVFDGSSAIELDPGDYYLEVRPASKAFTPKKLKVHLSGNQLLALPVVLNPAGPFPVP